MNIFVCYVLCTNVAIVPGIPFLPLCCCSLTATVTTAAAAASLLMCDRIESMSITDIIVTFQ